jgi:hypothetical protein
MGCKGQKHGPEMTNCRAIVACGFVLAAAGACAPTQQALLASGGAEDFAAMRQIKEDFGDGEPDAIVMGTFSDQERPLKVWISKTKPRVMVQNGLNSEIAGAAFTRGLTAGIANSGRPEYKPYADAAMSQLTAKFGPGCSIILLSPISHIGYQWDYSCQTPPDGNAAVARRTKHN